MPFTEIFALLLAAAMGAAAALFGSSRWQASRRAPAQRKLRQDCAKLRQHIAALQTRLSDKTSNDEAAAQLLQAADGQQAGVQAACNDQDLLQQHVTSLLHSLETSGKAIDEMAFGSAEVAKTLDELSGVCEETAMSMVAIDVSITAVQASADETSRLSGQVHADAETGTRALHQTIAGIDRIRDGNLSAARVIEDLGQQILAVGKILNVIDDVAEQTNLLALNAAIIAAQAGEYGRGFAVVADEIKALAERTGASTKEIADIILTIEAQSRRATDAMASGVANVQDGVRLGSNAQEALRKIVDSAMRSTAMAESIAKATVDQGQSSKAVTDAISRIAETVQQIAYATAEQAAGSANINESTKNMGQIVSSMRASADKDQTTLKSVQHFLQQLPQSLQQLQSQQSDQVQLQSQLAAEVMGALEALEHAGQASAVTSGGAV